MDIQKMTVSSCNGILGHRNGVAEVGKGTASFWEIFPRQIGDIRGWAIRSQNIGEFHNHDLSFSQDDMFIRLIEDDLAIWDIQLDTDFVESQSLDDVMFDLESGRIISEENVTLVADEVHNQADFEVDSDFLFKYEVSEGNKLLENFGIVLPIITSINMKDPIYTGEDFTLTDGIMYQVEWRAESRRVNAFRSLVKMTMPAKTFRMVSINSIKTVLSLSFTGLMRRKFSTGKEAINSVSGILISEQIRDITKKIGDALSLQNRTPAMYEISNQGHNIMGGVVQVKGETKISNRYTFENQTHKADTKGYQQPNITDLSDSLNIFGLIPNATDFDETATVSVKNDSAGEVILGEVSMNSDTSQLVSAAASNTSFNIAEIGGSNGTNSTTSGGFSSIEIIPERDAYVTNSTNDSEIELFRVHRDE